MHTTVVKWGNSQGIRIPKAFLRKMNILENDVVDVTLENDKIVVKKKVLKKHKTTKERILEFSGPDIDKKHSPQKEVDWGKPAGKEVW
jgi:antitoxin MazE